MKYKMLTVMLIGMSSCVAMNDTINDQTEISNDYLERYQKFAQEMCEVFTGEERKLMYKLSEIVPQKENSERYRLVDQCLKEIWKHRLNFKDYSGFLTSSFHLLDFDNTFHVDFDINNPLVKDIIDKMDAATMDGPE